MPDLANCSLAQQNFLKKQTRLRNRVRLARLLIFLGFLVLWEASTRMHLIDAFIFSSPTRLIICFYQMITGQKLLYHIGITLFETLSSFFFVIILTKKGSSV